jgi:hypothetical protein
MTADRRSPAWLVVVRTSPWGRLLLPVTRTSRQHDSSP